MPSFLPSTVATLQVIPLSPAQRRRRYRLFCVAVCCLGVFIVYLYAGIDLFADPIGDKLRTLNMAKRQWTAQRLTHYRVVVEIASYMRCMQDVEVYAEKVVRTFQNTCQLPVVTVSTLFEQISRDTPKIDWVNEHCDFLNVYPSFDPVLGYPTQIEYRQEYATPQNVGGLTYIAAHPLGRFDWSFCTLLGAFGRNIYVKSLTAIPQFTF